MGHVNSSAWGTEDPAWGGTRGGEAWGDTAAALIHPASRSSVRCCCRGEQGWRAHRRTLLSTELQGSQGTAGGTCTRCRVASKGCVSEKGWWCSPAQHHSPAATALLITRTFYTAATQGCHYLALKTSPGWLITNLKNACSATHALIHVNKKKLHC